MRYAIYTLGCKVNQYETQAMETILTGRGHTLTEFDAEADVYIINTCSVTAVSDKKCRNMIRRTKRTHPDALIAVCGCYAQAKPEEVAGLEVDLVAGTGDRMAFLDQVEQAALDRSAPAWVSVDDALKRHDFEVLPAGGLVGRTRAMLKVEDGCGNFCTYCIIPFARGPVRSLPLGTAVEQAKALAAEGYREIVVTGIEISSWGGDLPGKPVLADLLAALCAAVPGVRIRLGSLEPRTVTEAFCRRLCGFENLCPQFHLSLQSGCDTVLRRMNRRYDTARYRESADLLRRFFPGCAVTTDLIVGFPGETEAEFEASRRFLADTGLAAVHVFPYSRRAGTRAASMPDQISNAEKERRAHLAGETALACAERFRQGLIGTVQPVLFEQDEDGCSTGHAPCGVLVYLPEPGLHNEVRRVRITGLRPGGVTAEALPDGGTAGPAPR